jgi:hypothetical protein
MNQDLTQKFISLEGLGTLVVKNLDGKEQSMLRFDRSVPTYLAKVPTQDGKSDDPADDQTSAHRFGTFRDCAV